jgi:rare lipoprotein A (peptidoglycan hydrolase)
MKRILAILILIFITSLYTATVFSTIEEKPKMSEVIKTKTQKKSINPKKTSKKINKQIVVEKTTKVVEKTTKVVKLLGPELPPINVRNTPDSSIHHKATWYKTEGTRVHRDYPTAAYNYAPRGSKLLVTNLVNNKSCVVEVTDRNGMGKYHIDLSHSAFGYLEEHSRGTVKVLVKILEQ